MKRALGSGLVGACGVTLLNEIARKFLPWAPRLDLLGTRAVTRAIERAGWDPPREETRRGIALAGDLVSNALYYGLVGIGSPRTAWWRGGALGLAAGVGATVLPGPLGLGESPTNRMPATRAATAAWYVAGGLLAAWVFVASSRRGAAA